MKYEPYLLKDVHDESAQNKFNVISTFAGGGGSSTGYRLAGGNVLCVNEFVPTAQETYKENYSDTPIIPRFICLSDSIVMGLLDSYHWMKNLLEKYYFYFHKTLEFHLIHFCYLRQ